MKTTSTARRGLLSALLILAAGISSAFGAIVTVPSGLNPGDQYRLAFVTSTNHAALSSDIAFYNAAVTAQANTVSELSALGTVWTAIASTTAIDARDNTNTNPTLGTGVTIYLLNDTLLANNNADLWDGTLPTPFNVNEFGVVSFPSNDSSANRVTTGTQADGTVAAPVGSPTFRTVGDARGVNGTWVSNVVLDSRIGGHLYALSAPLTVPVPEPSGALLSLVGIAALGLRRRRK